MMVRSAEVEGLYYGDASMGGVRSLSTGEGVFVYAGPAAAEYAPSAALV